MKEILISVFVALLGGSAGATIVSGFNDRWTWKKNRKAQLEDKQMEKQDKAESIDKTLNEHTEHLKEQDQKIDLIGKAIRSFLLDRIIFTGKGYIQKGSIEFDEWENFHDMYLQYKNLGGNGNAEKIMQEVDKLQIIS